MRESPLITSEQISESFHTSNFQVTDYHKITRIVCSVYIPVFTGKSRLISKQWAEGSLPLFIAILAGMIIKCIFPVYGRQRVATWRILIIAQGPQPLVSVTGHPLLQ